MVLKAMVMFLYTKKQQKPGYGHINSVVINSVWSQQWISNVVSLNYNKGLFQINNKMIRTMMGLWAFRT